MARVSAGWLVVCLPMWVGTVGAQTAAPPQTVAPVLQRALEGYLADPKVGRRDLLAVARYGTDELPVPMALMVADAHLRAGRLAAAAAVFAEVAVRNPPPPFSAFVALGLGWIAVAKGNVVGARTHFNRRGRRPGCPRRGGAGHARAAPRHHPGSGRRSDALAAGR